MKEVFTLADPPFLILLFGALGMQSFSKLTHITPPKQAAGGRAGVLVVLKFY